MVHKSANRDSKGRLLPGHRLPGPGRPARPLEERYLKAFRGSVSVADFRRIVEVVLGKALQGDLGAAKLLLDRALPVDKLSQLQLVQIGRAEGQTIRVEYCNDWTRRGRFEDGDTPEESGAGSGELSSTPETQSGHSPI